jgi:hypothetical protein
MSMGKEARRARVQEAGVQERTELHRCYGLAIGRTLGFFEARVLGVPQSTRRVSPSASTLRTLELAKGTPRDYSQCPSVPQSTTPRLPCRTSARSSRRSAVQHRALGPARAVAGEYSRGTHTVGYSDYPHGGARRTQAGCSECARTGYSESSRERSGSTHISAPCSRGHADARACLVGVLSRTVCEFSRVQTKKPRCCLGTHE